MSMKEKVHDLKIDGDTTISELVSSYRDSGGFVAKKVGTAAEILEEMILEDYVNFFSFPACIVSTGTRGVIKEAVKREWFDVLVTTCGTLDHDLARMWEDYYHGRFDADDAELHRRNVNRLGNIFIPNSSYGEILEEKMQPLLEEIVEERGHSFSTKEIIWEFGRRIDDEDSILYWAAENEIPVYVPGITDGAFGFQLWMYWQNNELDIDLMKDEQELSDTVFSADKTGGLIIGGGISKHHTIWWNQFKGGLDRAVYITTAVEYDGSLSGARAEEAISWGKISEEADHCTVNGDATALLPLILGSLF
ncbi:MAG: deoxyhypusine synthase [Candidatus Natronoplasma sp.]